MDSHDPSDRGDRRPVPYRSRFELLRGSEGGGRGLRTSPAPADAWGDDEGLDLEHYLHVLWQKKLWILLATTLGVAAGFFLTKTVDPVYETRSTIWVEAGDDGSGPIEAEEVFEGRGWADLFASFAVLEPVARELKLYLDQASRNTRLAAGMTVSDSLRPGSYRLTRESADADTYVLAAQPDGATDRAPVGDSLGRRFGFEWAPGDDLLAPGSSMSFHVVSPVQAALRLRQNLQVMYNPRAGNLITTTMSWNDPVEAARIHNRIVRTFLDVASDLKSQKLREVVRTLEQQTDYAEERLADAELALESVRVENVTLPTESQAVPIAGAQQTRGPVFEAYFEQKVEADQLRNDLDELTSILERQRTQGELDVLRLRGVPSLSRSGELQSSLEELAEKEAERRSLLYTYTEQHPQVQELAEQIRVLRQQTIPAQVRELAAKLRSELETSRQEILAQERELREIPPRLIEEERLRREMQQAEQLHSDLLSRLKSAQLATATSRPNLQVVDEAQVPGSPVSNQAPRIFLMASLAGLGLGVLGALLHDRLDSSVREPADVERQLGLPVLGLVPRLPRDGGDGAEMRTVLESFRGIRAQLSQGMAPGRATVLVTSPEPRDGKSLVAANLAISFASSRRRTLLIDGDTRRGNAERLFGAKASPGLTECLSNGTALADVLQATDVPGLVLLAHGRLRGFDTELLDGSGMEALLEEVRERFDVVVVDGPPLAAGPDAALLGQKADQVLLVLRRGETDRDVAQTRLDGLIGFDLPLVGAVLNDVPESAPYYRYYTPYYYLEEGGVVS